MFSFQEKHFRWQFITVIYLLVKYTLTPLPMSTVALRVGGVAKELDQDISGSTSAPRLSEICFGV